MAGAVAEARKAEEAAGLIELVGPLTWVHPQQEAPAWRLKGGFIAGDSARVICMPSCLYHVVMRCDADGMHPCA